MMNLKSRIFGRLAAFFGMVICGSAFASATLTQLHEHDRDSDRIRFARTDRRPASDETAVVRPDDRDIDSPRRKSWEYTKNGGIVYSTPENDEPLKCDVYVPDLEGTYPAVLMIHGGAWRSGSKFHLIRHAWELTARGFVVVAINYRHAPRHKFPAQIHDGKTALRWMKKNAVTYKIDPERIGVYGYSAGGHLAALLGTTTPDDRLEGQPNPELQSFSTTVQAVAIGGAPCEFSWIGRDSRTLVYLFGATRAEKPERYRRASPITFVDSKEVPFRIFHGKSDPLVPLRSAKTFFQKLQDSGVECEAEWLDSGHFGAFSDFQAFDRTIDFFEEHLGRPVLNPPAKN